VLFDKRATPVARASARHQTFFPSPGFVEHDAEEIYRNLLDVACRCVADAGIAETELAAIAITNQRETSLIWDRTTGRPIAKAAVWQCLRGEERCRALGAAGHGDLVREKSGLLLDPYFSASKIAWMLDHVPDARERAEAGELLFGTIDSWLVWKLSGGATHITDYTNASRTLLFDIVARSWSPELFSLFNVPLDMAPRIVPSDLVVGTTRRGEPFETEVPIAGIMGDSHAALFGQACFEPGSAKATYGTGSSVMLNIGASPLSTGGGVVTSIGYALSSTVAYVLEGNIHSTGGTVQWLVDSLGIIPEAAAAGEIAASIDSTDGVYFVPAFAGLGAPYWDNDARAIITGMSRGTRAGHIIRAAEESIAYQIADLIEAMERESGMPVESLRADGGVIRDRFLMQFQADILDRPVRCAGIEESSALGSAFAAGLAVGVWSGLEGLRALASQGTEYRPTMDRGRREALIAGWREAVGRARSQPTNGSANGTGGL
jgi:glycerol kinase